MLLLPVLLESLAFFMFVQLWHSLKKKKTIFLIAITD